MTRILLVDDHPLLRQGIAMTLDAESEDEPRAALQLKLRGNRGDVAAWGAEYVRCLTAQLAAEFAARRESGADAADVHTMVDLLVPYYLSENAEPEAADLLLETDRIEAIEPACDAGNYERVCLYLASFAHFVPGPDDERILRIVMRLYRTHNRLTEALRFAMRLHDKKLVKAIFHQVPKSDYALRSQMAYMLGEQRMFILDDDDEDEDEDADDNQMAEDNDEEADEEKEEEIQRKINNAHLSEAFLVLAEDLDTLDPKVPEDIYKSHLETSRAG